MEYKFIEVYNLLKNDILRLAFSYTKNLSDAEDITQEVFIKLYENFEEFNDEEHIRKWCIKVAINKCKNLFFSAWKKKISYLTRKEENKEYQLMQDNTMLEAILSLKKKYRIVIILYYYNGYKIKEIAKLLKINISTVKTRLRRARIELANMIREDEDNDK